jgi:hypothetical protein
MAAVSSLSEHAREIVLSLSRRLVRRNPRIRPEQNPNVMSGAIFGFCFVSSAYCALNTCLSNEKSDVG